MMRVLALVSMAVVLTGCAEFYRWPDRMAPRAQTERYDKAPAEGHYVVKPGDALYSIAFRHQLDFRELAVWNDIGPDYLIRPGQVLRLAPPELGPRNPDSSPDSSPGSTGSTGSSTGSIQTYPATRPVPKVIPVYEPPPVYTWQWPTAGSVVKKFGEGGKGMDIAGALGQPVMAAAAGKVVYSGSALKGYGELIIIKHDDLYLSAYGYNRRRLVNEGAVVAAGQAIAELGLGPEQKPILHFEVREKGKPVNPAKLLPER